MPFFALLSFMWRINVFRKPLSLFSLLAVKASLTEWMNLGSLSVAASAFSNTCEIGSNAILMVRSLKLLSLTGTPYSELSSAVRRCWPSMTSSFGASYVFALVPIDDFLSL